jgi:hypothetical protein
MSRTPAPNQLRWMAGWSLALGSISGVAVAFAFGGLNQPSGAAFSTALVIGGIAAATSFAVSMLLFVGTMPRMQPRTAAWLSLALGAVAAFVVGYVLTTISGPVF